MCGPLGTQVAVTAVAKEVAHDGIDLAYDTARQAYLMDLCTDVDWYDRLRVAVGRFVPHRLAAVRDERPAPAEKTLLAVRVGGAFAFRMTVYSRGNKPRGAHAGDLGVFV